MLGPHSAGPGRGAAPAALFAAALLASTLAGCAAGGSLRDGAAARAAWRGCAAYPARARAQLAWEAAGRPARADGDGDGRVCESLPARARGGGSGGPCRRAARPVVVLLSRARYPETTLHIEAAIAGGAPAVLHVSRGRADTRRAAWHPLVPEASAGKDRDEWPMAFTAEGGRTASIAFVAPADNRGAGSVIAERLRRYCDGTPFRVRAFSHRTRPTRILIAARGGRPVRETAEG
jgi:hypothetical protein